MKNQIPLSFPVRESYKAEDFMPAECNQAALDWINRFPSWPSPLVIFSGDFGAGKTHLLHLWANKANARVIDMKPLRNSGGSDDKNPSYDLRPKGFAGQDQNDIPGKLKENIAIDDAHLGFGDADFEQNLFHLYNQAKENLTYVLLSMSNKLGENEGCYDDVGRANNALDRIALPDLKSRLKAAPMVIIDQPDDMALQAVLVKLFHDRQLKVEPGVINYILPRIERSFHAARTLVARIDENALAEKRSVTVHLVRGLIEG